MKTACDYPMRLAAGKGVSYLTNTSHVGPALSEFRQIGELLVSGAIPPRRGRGALSEIRREIARLSEDHLRLAADQGR